MKNILLLIFSLGVLNLSYGQLEKEDVKEIFSHIDVKSFPKFYISFSNEVSGKHKMENENLAAYESLNTGTLKLEFNSHYLKISGDSYMVFLPYDKIKYVHTVKAHSIQIRVSE